MAAESNTGMIFTRCPVAGQKLATGIETDAASLALAPPFTGRVYCPHCNVEHPWKKTNAWIGDPGPPSDAAA